MKKSIFAVLSIFTVFQINAQQKEIDVLDVFGGKMEELNWVYILNDGTIQLTGHKKVYKIDADGNKLGEPETMPPTISKSTSMTAERSQGSFYDRNVRYSRFGESIEFTYMKSDGPNEYYDVPMKQLKGVTGSGTAPKVADAHSQSSGVHMIDDNNAIYYASYVSRCDLSHPKQKFSSKNVYTFLRLVKINIKEKKTEEVYTCIDLVSETRDVYNDVEFQVLDDSNNDKLILGVRKCKSVLNASNEGFYYDLRESSKGVFEIYSLDLKTLELEKIQSVEIGVPEAAVAMNYAYYSDGIKLKWVEKIAGTQSYSLHMKSYRLNDEGTELEERTVHFPEEVVALVKPIPMSIVDYTDLNNKKWTFVQGNFVKSKRDKNPVPLIVMLDEEGNVEFKNGHKKHSIGEFAFYDPELDRARYLTLERDIAEEELDNLVKPLLNETKMNYMVKDSRFHIRKVGSEIIFVHCDYRGGGSGFTSRLTDFKMVIGKL
ncbi:hypothetical protein [Fluviicola sp.]|uniref:hypothetical protein n=1 Tax=Fluviicola sp. TaxID=1917219 RepID=UPI0031DFD258